MDNLHIAKSEANYWAKWSVPWLVMSVCILLATIKWATPSLLFLAAVPFVCGTGSLLYGWSRLQVDGEQDSLQQNLTYRLSYTGTERTYALSASGQALSTVHIKRDRCECKHRIEHGVHKQTFLYGWSADNKQPTVELQTTQTTSKELYQLLPSKRGWNLVQISLEGEKTVVAQVYFENCSNGSLQVQFYRQLEPSHSCVLTLFRANYFFL
ncbi:hypothetical protein [Bacillus fonticola]|uniref:hypothetical protein n=1 Tax=Bacillus fonticola TaxID=2728853 RepID=UPI001475583F|nr:hypothetical protein [Bacillus fonticola]